MRMQYLVEMTLHAKHSTRVQTSTVNIYWENCRAAMVASKVLPSLLLHWLWVWPSCPRRWSHLTGREFLLLSTPWDPFERDVLRMSTITDAHRLLLPIHSL